MADNIKVAQQNVKDLTNNVKQLASIFNGASDNVTQDIYQMDMSFGDLRKKVNELAKDSETLGKKLDVAVSKGNTGAINDAVADFKRLDSEMGKLSGAINSHIGEMNKAFSREFYTEGVYRGVAKKLNEMREAGKDSTKEYENLRDTMMDMENINGFNGIKTSLNSLSSSFKEVNTRSIRSLKEIKPEMQDFVDNFIAQVDEIEAGMGKLTRYGAVRNGVEKALGFTVTRQDISSELIEKQTELSGTKDEFNKYYGGKKFKDLSEGNKEFYKELEDNIKNLEQSIKALDSSVGQKVTGYVDLFNKANNLLDSGEVNKGLINEIAFNPFPVFSDEQMKGLSATDFNKYMTNNNDDMMALLGGSSGVETAKEDVKQVVKQYDDLGNKLKEIMESDGTLSDEIKQQLTDASSLNKLIEDRKKALGYVKSDLEAISNIEINQNTTPIELKGATGAAELTNYKARIEEALEAVKELKKEQQETTGKLGTKSGLLDMRDVRYNDDAVKQVKDVLESGYRINIKQGTDAHDKLKEIEGTFKNIIDGYKNTKLAVVDDKDIEDAVKIKRLEEAIAKEKNNQAQLAKAQASYENDKVKYLELQVQSAEKQRTIKAYKYMMEKEKAGAKTASEKNAITNRYTSKERYNTSTKEYEGKNGILTKVEYDKASVDRELSKLQQQFEKYGLEVPVKPKLDNVKIGMNSADYEKYLQYRLGDLKEFRGTMSGLEQDTEGLSAKANELGLNVSKLVGRLNAVGNTAKTAFNSGDIERVNRLVGEYRNILRQLEGKVSGGAKARGIANNNEADSYKRLLTEVKSYVATQEAMSGKKMDYQDQADYYTNQLPRFVKNSQEYIEVLKLKNKAEENAAKASESAASNAAKASESAASNAARAVKDRTKAIIDIVRNLSGFINNAVNKIISIVRSGINIVGKVIQSITRAISGIKSTIERLLTLFGGFGNRVKSAFGIATSGSDGTNKSFNILKGTATELYSKIRLLEMAFNSVFNNQQVKNALELYQSVYSLKNIVGTGLTQDTINWAEKMEYAFGISAKGLITDLNELSGVLYGLGMKTQDVAVGSQNLLMIGRYLAFMGGAGGDLNKVMDKLVSGMKGMTQAVDDLGLSVREAQMDSYLKDLKKQGGEFANIGTSFASLNEEARIYVRYASLIGQFNSKYNLADFAKALDTTSGRISILQQSVYSLGTTLGQVFVKLIAGIAPAVTVVVKFIERQITGLTAWLSKVFNLDLSTEMWHGMNEGAGAVEDVTGNVDDLNDKLDEADKKAKKAKGSLADFDKISSLDDNTKDSDNGLGDFDYSKLMTSALDGLNAVADKAAESYIDTLNKRFEDGVNSLKQKLADSIKDVTGRLDFDIEFDKEQAINSIKSILKNVKDIVKNIDVTVIQLGLKFADDINIGKVLNDVLKLVDAVTGLASAFSEVLGKALNYVYDEYLSKYVKIFGVDLGEAIDKAVESIDKIAEKIRQADYKKDVDSLVDTLKTLYQIFDGEPVFLDDTISMIEFKEAHPIISGLVEIFGVLKDILVILYKQVLKPLLGALGEFAKNGLLPWLLEKLKELKDYVNVDSLVDTLKTLYQIFDGEPVSLDDTISMIKFKEAHPIISGLVEIFGVLKDILVILYEQVLKPLLGALEEFAKNELLPWLLEKLKELKDYVNDNSDKIVEFLKNIASIAWEAFQKFVDLVGKLVAFVIENPDAIAKFFGVLIGLKVASWLGDTTAGIADLVVKLLELKALASGGSTLATLFGGGGAAAAGTAGAAGAGGAAAGAGAAGAGAAGGGAAAAGGIALGPILAIVAAVLALVAAFVDLWKTSEQFREVFKWFGDTIKGSFSEAIEKIKEGFGSIKTAWDNFYTAYEQSGIKDLLTGLFVGIGYIVTVVVDLVVSALGTIIKFIGNIVADIINVLSGVFDVLGGFADIIIGIFTLDGEKIWNGIKQVGAGVIEIIAGLLQGIWDILGGAIGIVLDIIDSIFLGAIQGIKDAWNGVWNAVRTFFDDLIKNVKEFLGIHSPSTVFAEIGEFLIQGLWQGIKDTFSWLTDNVVKAFTGLLDGIKNVFSGIGEWFGNTFSKAKDFAVNAWSGIKEKFGSIKDNVVSGFNTLKENIGSKFTSAKDAAVNAWGNVTGTFSNISSNIYNSFDGLKGKFSSLWSTIKTNADSILGGIGNTVSSIWDKAKNGISGMWDAVTGNTKSATTVSKMPDITMHASGGSKAAGQLFIANDNGPELVGNIRSARGTDIANNGMIIQALKMAMSEGLLDGLYDLVAQMSNNKSGGDTHIHLGENGLNMYDQSTIATIASIIAPYMNKTNITRADNGFSLT